MILFSLSKVCRIFSADCFYSGFTASQSPQLRLRSIVGYTLLISLLFCFTFASKVFLYVIRRKVRLKNFFNLCLTSFLCLLHFVLLFVFALTSPRKINYLSILYGHLQAVLSGYFTRILQKNCREIFPTTAYKKEVRYYSNFLFSF